MYMYIATKRRLFVVFPEADVMSSYGLNSSSGNDIMSLHGHVVNPFGEVIKMVFLLISLCRETLLLCIVRILSSFLRMSLYAGKQLLYIKTFTVYGNTYMLGTGMVIPYTDVNKMAGNFIR